MRDKIFTYEGAMEYLLDIPKFTGKNSLGDTKLFLQRLSNPEQKMQIIHIAGTNGKGSVCAYLRSVLMEMGYSVGTFTSPHLIEMNERIQIEGIPVSDEEMLMGFRRVYDEIWRLKEEEDSKYHPSFFEYIFFMAMVIFEDKKPDYVILETGLGGRLDATNAVMNPLVSVITSIGMDHMQYLGDTIALIAGEKAGIIKPGIPVVYCDGDSYVADIIKQKATETGSTSFSVSNKDYAFLNFKNKTIDFSYHSRYYDYVRLCLDTTAFYQMENASIALRTAEVLFDSGEVTPDIMAKAVFCTHWEGRMEEVCPDVYVDGAHNEAGIKAFLDSVSMDNCNGERILIFGAVSDKAYEQMIRQITNSRLFIKVAVVNMDNSRALSADELKSIFKKHSATEPTVWSDVASAYEALAKEKKEFDRIYVAGSLYLVGEFKGYLRMRGYND